MRRATLTVLAGGLAAAMLLGAGCYRVPFERDRGSEGEARTETRSVALEGAERLQARIRMGVGDLRMSSAEGSEAVETEFVYSRRSWRPEVSYEVAGDTGRFEVRQPEVRGLRDLLRDGRSPRDSRYSWEIGLPAGVPTDLQLDFGVGDAEVALGGLALEELRVNAGVGDVTIDLGGEWTDDLDARIEAGVGTVTLLVPRDVGVRVSGREDGLGDFRADGMRVEGDAYVNDAYGESDVTLDIELRRGVGDVRIELVD